MIYKKNLIYIIKINSASNKFMRNYILILFFIPTFCQAADLKYQCTVNTEMSLQDNGNLKNYLLPINKGKIFEVDRVSGIIDKPPLRNKTASEIRVLNRGDKNHNYELLSTSSPTAKVTNDLLIIHEFVKSKGKPFVAINSLGEVYSGICE